MTTKELLYKSHRYNLTFHLNVTQSFSGNFIGPNTESITIGPLRHQQYWMYHDWPKVCKFNNLWVETAIQYIYFNKTILRKLNLSIFKLTLAIFQCVYIWVSVTKSGQIYTWCKKCWQPLEPVWKGYDQTEPHKKPSKHMQRTHFKTLTSFKINANQLPKHFAKLIK